MYDSMVEPKTVGYTGCFILAWAIFVTPVCAHADCERWEDPMTGSQVVPPSDASWTDVAHLGVCYGIPGMSSLAGRQCRPRTSETVTAIHLHGPASPGANGPVIMSLYGSSNPPFDCLIGPSPWIPDAVVPMLLSGQCYVDVHTTEHPNGAVRGQIHHTVAVAFEGWTRVKVLYR